MQGRQEPLGALGLLAGEEHLAQGSQPGRSLDFRLKGWRGLCPSLASEATSSGQERPVPESEALRVSLPLPQLLRGLGQVT